MNNEVLQTIIEELQQIAELLYQENIQPAYAMLANVLPRIEVLISGIEDDSVRDELVEKFGAALGAMEEEDNTLLADILQYEIIETLQQYI